MTDKDFIEELKCKRDRGNLNLPQMAQRCPTAKVLSKSELNDYELLFRGSKTGFYATVEPCEGKSVPVLLWTVGKKDELARDRYEGYPTFYEKENMTVEVDGQTVYGRRTGAGAAKLVWLWRNEMVVSY